MKIAFYSDDFEDDSKAEIDLTLIQSKISELFPDIIPLGLSRFELKLCNQYTLVGLRSSVLENVWYISLIDVCNELLTDSIYRVEYSKGECNYDLLV